MIERFTDPRFVVSILIMAIFGWAFGENVGDDTMKGAIIGALNIAVGFWLGSSRGAATANENMGKALDLAATPTEPQPVKVVNPASEPVQTEEAK